MPNTFWKCQISCTAHSDPHIGLPATTQADGSQDETLTPIGMEDLLWDPCETSFHLCVLHISVEVTAFCCLSCLEIIANLHCPGYSFLELLHTCYCSRLKRNNTKYSNFAGHWIQKQEVWNREVKLTWFWCCCFLWFLQQKWAEFSLEIGLPKKVTLLRITNVLLSVTPAFCKPAGQSRLASNWMQISQESSWTLIIPL